MIPRRVFPVANPRKHNSKIREESNATDCCMRSAKPITQRRLLLLTTETTRLRHSSCVCIVEVEFLDWHVCDPSKRWKTEPIASVPSSRCRSNVFSKPARRARSPSSPIPPTPIFSTIGTEFVTASRFFESKMRWMSGAFFTPSTSFKTCATRWTQNRRTLSVSTANTTPDWASVV